jgi:hypothetical protein
VFTALKYETAVLKLKTKIHSGLVSDLSAEVARMVDRIGTKERLWSYPAGAGRCRSTSDLSGYSCGLATPSKPPVTLEFDYVDVIFGRDLIQRGFARTLMILADASNLREVIPFLKTAPGGKHQGQPRSRGSARIQCT